jgi:hypothetical protein
MKKPTEEEHQQAFYDAMYEQMEDAAIARKVKNAFRDAAIDGEGIIKIEHEDLIDKKKKKK